MDVKSLQEASFDKITNKSLINENIYEKLRLIKRWRIAITIMNFARCLQLPISYMGDFPKDLMNGYQFEDITLTYTDSNDMKQVNEIKKK